MEISKASYINRITDRDLAIKINSTDESKAKLLDEILNEIGIGYFHYRLLILCGLSFMADSMETSLLGYLSICAGLTFGLDDSQRASISGVVFAGQIFGSLVWGKVGDKFGRRTSFILSASIVCVFGFVSGFSPNFMSLLILRALVGNARINILQSLFKTLLQSKLQSPL